jgi:2,4-dienoyl-CoA reductase (NADPH2)
MPARTSFEHLLAPGRIGPVEVRNRILLSAMGTNLAEPDGHAGERIQRHYEERARGGAGIVIAGVGAIAYPAGACIPRQLAISSDAFLPGLRALAKRVHAHGAKVAIQLQHAGKVATQDTAAGRPLWVPSAVAGKRGDLMNDLAPHEVAAIAAPFTKPGASFGFHEMTREDIATLVGWFADAADRVRRAGFDGVEIHGAHGYLLSSFLSPASNARTDEYGGTLENRARLLCEVIRAVKARVGGDLAVWVRLDATEFRVANGITLEDAQRSAELAEAAGADAIHVTAYADPTCGVAFTDAPLVHEPRGYLAFAERIKQGLRIPVIAVGRIEPGEADAAIRDGKADFIAMARALLADPALPRKLAEGRPGDVRPCIYCYTCVGRIFLNESVACAVNPAVGREGEFEIFPAQRSRRVLVVGGGPAGMEAARIAALRGHRVTLCERGPRLGGTLLFSSLVYEPNGRLAAHLETQVRKAGVELLLDTVVTEALVRELAPDVVLVATGARREAPAIPGADRPNVLSGDDLRSLLTGSDPDVAKQKLSFVQRAVIGAGRFVGATGDAALTRELSRRWMPLGRRVVIVGGGLVGVELAEFLSAREREVTVLEEGATLAPEMALPRRWRALFESRERGVRFVTRAQVLAISDTEVVYADASGTRSSVPADHVILAVGAREDRSLGEALGGLGIEVHLIGDCDGVGYVEGAMLGAARVAGSL